MTLGSFSTNFKETPLCSFTSAGSAVMGLLFLLVVSPCTAAAASADVPSIGFPLVVTQLPAAQKLPTLLPGEGPRDVDGARIVVVETDGKVRLLSEGFASACDPNVFFDGTRVLFAGRKGQQAEWRIWEIGLSGQNLRPVTPEGLDARSPIYAATLFTLESPEPWLTTVFVGREPGKSPLTSLYNIKLDGSELRRITFNPNGNFNPVQMTDGRVVYSAERRSVENPLAAIRVGLFAIHIEGADMELYGGEQGGRAQYMPCATEKGLVVFVEPEAGARTVGGQLACVLERRPHLSYKRLTQDQAWSFQSPSALHDNVVLVARVASNGRGTWGICSFDADTGQTKPVFDTREYHEIQAVAAKPRLTPDGHSTVVDTKSASGVFYGLNCYDTDQRLAPYMRTGMVKRVRFIEGILPQKTDPAGPKMPLPMRLVGEAPVEADGSFHVDVPADTPLLLQTLDERGLALANCGWIWVKPAEKRGCIGCHEDPERVPENEYVLALHRPSNKLVLPPSERRSISFKQDIAPLFQNQCATADCHAAGKTPLAMPARVENSDDEQLRRVYAALVAPAKIASGSLTGSNGKYIDAGRARTSPLVWRLMGADVSRPWDKSGNASSSKSTSKTSFEKHGKLNDDQLKTVIQWIDMGAQYEQVTGASDNLAATK